ncbi:MAG: hypothetical protein U5Q03_19655 [Bacteroidota bacterium]|nr:hypothetical protein [Bacteroidota bacterium]
MKHESNISTGNKAISEYQLTIKLNGFILDDKPIKISTGQIITYTI